MQPTMHWARTMAEAVAQGRATEETAHSRVENFAKDLEKAGWPELAKSHRGEFSCWLGVLVK